MSLTKRILFGAAASWFSRGVTIVLGLVLLPVLFRTLPKEELGVWLLLGQSWATLGILDLGFGVTITRRIAFAKGKSGSDPSAPLTASSLAEIADLLATGRRIYRVLALASFVLAFVLGAFYLNTLELQQVHSTTTWIAWGLLCLSFSLTTLAAPWACLLQGVGYVGWDAILTSFVSALTLLAQIVAALLGGGLISLAAIAVAGALAQRLVFFSFARKKRPELFLLSGSWQSGIFEEMRPLALRAWLTSIGSSMLLYTDQFVISSLHSPSDLPAYRAAWILVHNLTILATGLGVASSVFVSHLWQSKQLGPVHRILERNVRFAWFLMLAGAAVLLFAGEGLFTLWLGHGTFIGYPILMAFLITEMLEAQSHVISCASRATGDEAFAWTSLLAGCMKLLFSLLLAKHYGLLGVALGTVFALAVTNHWYVPFKGLRSLHYPRWRLVGKTVLPALLWFGVLCAILLITKAGTSSLNSAINLALVSSVTLFMLALALWTNVLEPDQRDRLKTWAARRLSPV